MLLRLADRLEIPLRERNGLLIAGGFAPVYAERPLDDPALIAAREAVDLVLAGHEPYPAIAIDRHWTLIAFNTAIPRLLTAVDPEQLKPPVNVLRLSLHPDGLAPSIINLGQWRAHLLERLRRQIEVSGDPVLADLLHELSSYPVEEEQPAPRISGEQRRRRTAQPAVGRDDARSLQHHHHLRHPGRHHPLRAGDRVVLPRQRGNGGAASIGRKP